jgi:hypothetical protein
LGEDGGELAGFDVVQDHLSRAGDDERHVVASVIRAVWGRPARRNSLRRFFPRDPPRPGSVSSPCVAGTPGVDDAYAFDTVLAAELPDGVDVVGASHYRPGQLVVVLHAITASCHPASGFGDHGTVALTTSGSSLSEIDAMSATKDGQLLLAGSDGSNEIVGRLLGDGRIDTSFGSDSWMRFRPPEKPVAVSNAPGYQATSISQAPSGMVFVGANDGQAHCCVESFVSELTPRGILVGSFGERGSVALPQLQGSYTTSVFPQATGVLVAGQYEGMGCGGPMIVRLNGTGGLDRAFDSHLAASLKASLAPDVLFTPVVVPGRNGTFDLLGDAVASCALNPHPPSQGLGLEFTGDGYLDRSFGNLGRLSFASDEDIGNGTWGTRLENGRLLLVTIAYSSLRSGTAVGLRVREFLGTGRVADAFGHGGVVNLNNKAIAAILNDQDISPSVAIIPAPDQGELITVASVRQIDVVRLQA